MKKKRCLKLLLALVLALSMLTPTLSAFADLPRSEEGPPSEITQFAPASDNGSDGVRFGLEVLLEDPVQRAKLFGKNVALYTNQVFVDANMNSAIKGYADATDFTLVSMFAGEHGVRGQYQAGAFVPHEIDVETGVLIWSLYGSPNPTSPTADVLRTRNIPQAITDALGGPYKYEGEMIDVVLFDLPDIGSVTWTYLYTLADLMKALIEFELYYDVNGNQKCDGINGALGRELTEEELRAIPGHRIQLIVLDRPNPLGGLVVEGPVRDLRYVPGTSTGAVLNSGQGDNQSITSNDFTRFPMPSRYGMTMGELALMFAGEWEHNWSTTRNSTLNPHRDRTLTANSRVRDLSEAYLDVIPVQGWTRDMYWDDWDPTGARFIMPSPNMPTWAAAFAYAGTVWHEGTNIGERGTTPVWTLLHAPYINGFELAERLNALADELGLHGAVYRAAANTPINSSSQTRNFPGVFSDGIEIHITDKHQYRAIDDVILHTLVLSAMYGTTNNANPADSSTFHVANGMNIRVGNNIIKNAFQVFPPGSSDAEIIAEFHRLKNIIYYGDEENGVPGQAEFLAARLNYLKPEYGSPDPADYDLAPPAAPAVVLGYENLISNNLDLLQGKRVGLVANQSSVTKELGHVVDLLGGDSRIDLTTLFAPAPGLRGLNQDVVLTGTGVSARASYPGGTTYTDVPTGLPVHRLAGANTVPTAAMLAGIDVLLFDIQDSGVRYNSSISLLADVMKACADNGVQLIVLDRPSMIDGATVDGPVAEDGFGYAIPIRYGMTIGELAKLLKNSLGYITDSQTESFANLDMVIVQMSNYDPNMYAKELGLPFVAPSGGATLTNAAGHVSPIVIGTYEAALAYSVIGLIEGTPLFDGVGTTRSLEAVGAPFITPQLVNFKYAMDAFNLPGVGMRTIVHLPWANGTHGQATAHGVKFAGTNNVSGVQLHISDFHAFDTMATALALLTTLRDLFPGDITAATFPASFDAAAGNTWLKDMILSGAGISAMMDQYQPGLDAFGALRERNLIYGTHQPLAATGGVQGVAARVVGLPVEFYLWVDAYDIQHVNYMELEFTVCSNLHYVGIEGLDAKFGFSPIALDGAIGGIVWTRLQDGGHRGLLRLGLLDGSAIDIDGLIDDIVKLSFEAFDLGDATMTLETFTLFATPPGAKDVVIEVDIVEGSVKTAIVEAPIVYSIYDLNKDGRVNGSDLAIALRAISWTADSPDWNDYVIAIDRNDDPITPAMVDVSQGGAGDGVINMLDIIDILRNFT